MSRKPTGNPNGRPPREFNAQIFENLCQIQCTVNEIEAVFQTDQRTVDKWCQREYGESFSTIYKRFTETGKPSLRRFQWNLAKTNTSMAIWLGKQYLGQRDHDEDKKGIAPNDAALTELISEVKALKEKENASKS